MKHLHERLKTIEQHIKSGQATVMIIGLGSVGTYLLDYLVSKNDAALHIVVAGRSRDKMEKNVNIVRIAGLIRQVNKSQVDIEAEVDLTNIKSIKSAVEKWKPDFIVNSSRAYPGLKYGSISWQNIRAYGIWTPLAIRFTKNIMEACEQAGTEAVVINTSYSDAVIPWLKSAKKAYPDFGSGNLNHLIPRIRYAAAEMLGVNDFWNISVDFAAGHFHDVCISKEGHTQGVELPLRICYKDEVKQLDQEKIFKACSIPMPVDAQRNMMNASSNFAIIDAIIQTVRTGKNHKIFIPGAFGNLGGYPVIVGYRDGMLDARIDESVFSFEKMSQCNQKSMYLDGVKKICDGALYYTDELIQNVKDAFGAELPKRVGFDEIEKTSQFLIDEIIKPNVKNS